MDVNDTGRCTTIFRVLLSLCAKSSQFNYIDKELNAVLEMYRK